MLHLLKDLIDTSHVVSFDVFDTLVCRKVEEPESIFDIVGHISGIKNFRSIREKAQQNAFQYMHECGKHEISMTDIYKFISNGKILMEKECGVELDIIYLNKEMIGIYNYCIENGKKVIITSDMYLEKSFFEQLFIKLGLY